MADVAIQNTVSRFFAAVDGRDWEGCRALMTTPIHIDYASFGGGEAADLAPDAVLAGWRGLLPGFDATHHQLGNFVVEQGDGSAEVSCYVTATHLLGERVWTVLGAYRIGLRREAAGWLLRSLRLDFKAQTGAMELPAEATKVVEGGGA